MIDDEGNFVVTEEEITTIEMKKSLILFSGGLDTTVLLYKLIQEEIPVQCLIFDYGQQAKQEIVYAKRTCEKLNVKYKVMDISSLEISGELGEGGNIENSMDIIIPNRNSIFLAIATNYAIRQGCEAIYIGSKQGIKSCYDETYEFIEEYNYLNHNSDIKYIPVKAPLIDMDSLEVVEEALKLQIPLNETWSCFGNTTERCKKCKNCKLFPDVLNAKLNEYNSYINNLQTYLNELE